MSGKLSPVSTPIFAITIKYSPKAVVEIYQNLRQIEDRREMIQYAQAQ